MFTPYAPAGAKAPAAATIAAVATWPDFSDGNLGPDSTDDNLRPDFLDGNLGPDCVCGCFEICAFCNFLFCHCEQNNINVPVPHVNVKEFATCHRALVPQAPRVAQGPPRALQGPQGPSRAILGRKKNIFWSKMPSVESGPRLSSVESGPRLPSEKSGQVAAAARVAWGWSLSLLFWWFLALATLQI